MENEQVNKVINRFNRLLSYYRYFIYIKKRYIIIELVGEKIQNKYLDFWIFKKKP